MDNAPADTTPRDTSATESPRPVKGLSGALTRFRVMAFVTGVVLAFMTCVGMPYKFLTHQVTTWYSLGWMAHGWLYIAYVAVALDLVFRLRWHLGRALLILVAGTIPFMSFVAEHYVTKRVRPMIDPADSVQG
ncbi:MAG: DUF3817 domain-containing protein [Candidatus Nanopelagicales bacterium]